MNFLAHLFLSGDDTELLVGNFMGDFVRSRQDVEYTLGIQAGLKLHRHIDHFTDTHPIVRESVRLLQPLHRKYATVILDVFYDFLLTRNWALYTHKDLDAFIMHTYRTLEGYVDVMPPVLQQRLPHMIMDDWLTRYGRWDGLSIAFSQMKQKASVPEHFDHVVENLRAQLEPLDERFRQFFPDLLNHVEEIRTQ